MASKADIKAGGAFVELFVKDAKFKQQIAGASTTLRGLATSAAAIGAGMAAAGAAILTPLAAAVAHFVEAGGELDDMAHRTGVSAQRLAFWNYAAGQTGARIEDIEKAMRDVRKRGFTPEDFDRLAQEISRIPDPLARAARAADLFGAKSGMILLPMFEQLADLEARWKELDLAPSQDQIALADQLGDLWMDLQASASALAIEIGAALAPAAKELTVLLIPVIRQFRDWIRANPQAVTALATLGAVLFVLGASLASVAATVAPVVAFIAALAAGNIGAIVVVLVALALAWYAIVAALAKASGAWDRFFKVISRALGPLLGTIKKTFKGIADAIRAGDMELAWEIAVAGMAVIWHRFKQQVLQGVLEIHEAIAGLARVLGSLSGLVTGPLFSAQGDRLREMVRGAGLDAALSEALVKRLSKGAAARGQQGQGGRPQDYPLPTANAGIIGTNAFSALRGAGVIGGGNPVHDTLKKQLKADMDALKVLGELNRKTKGPPKWK